MSTTTTTLPNFTPITPSISFYKAPPSPSDTPPSPSLLVLCSWMAAAPKHIQKYTTQYNLVFPYTSILLLQCSLPAIFYSSKKHSTLLSPARDIIRSFQSSSYNGGGGGGGKIVLHAFSNGGSTIACHLSSQLTSSDDGGDWAGFEKIILDCCPSYPTVTGAVDAISFSLPENYILHLLGRGFLRLVVCVYLLLWTRLAGREDGVKWIRRNLNDGSVFKKRDAERLYIFSGEDALVQDWAVEMHAKEAEGMGYIVHRERFEIGKHCALGVREGKERYWDAIRGFFRGDGVGA